MPEASVTQPLAAGRTPGLCGGALRHGASRPRRANLDRRHAWPAWEQLLSTPTQFLCLHYPDAWSKHGPNDCFICSCVF